MKSTVFRGPLVTAALAGLIYSSALCAETPVTNPWTKVPPLPTGCYSGQDDYYQKNEAALDAVSQAHYRQDEINGDIRQKSIDANAADPMAAARRMQEAMMADPANAQKYLEQVMHQGQQAQTEVPAQQEKEKQIEAESVTVMKQYQAALARAMVPAEARWTALKKKYGLPADAPGPGESGVADWVWAEWGVILRQRDQGYRAACAQWWAATGPIHAYMKRYKDYLVLERIPYEKKFIEEPALQAYQAQGVPTTGWRTVTDYDAAEDYLKMAYKLFGERRDRPYCGADGRCE
jgi:hypothetical protein